MRLLLVFLFLALVSPSFAQTLQGLRVRGNLIVNGNGQTVKLRGVNRSGAEFTCIQAQGIFNGPMDQASVDVIKSWKTNIIRVPLNEDCWLLINGVLPQYGGDTCQKAISDYVDLLNRNGFAVVLDLHLAAPGTEVANKQLPMADADHSPLFWEQVARKFGNNSMVIFDLYNEPFPENGAWDGETAWTCWRDGVCPSSAYKVAGMQSLVDTVRNAGSSNILALGGLQWSDSLGSWLQYKPHDPLGQTIPSWHNYNFNKCVNKQCWDTNIAPLAAQLPIIVTEFGENDCTGDYITPLLQWMDSHGLHYTAWAWNTWDCKVGPALISSYDGTPTGYGQAYKSYLLGVVE